MINRSSCKLRLVDARNHQKKNIVMAPIYEDRFDLFEK